MIVDAEFDELELEHDELSVSLGCASSSETCSGSDTSRMSTLSWFEESSSEEFDRVD